MPIEEIPNNPQKLLKFYKSHDKDLGHWYEEFDIPCYAHVYSSKEYAIVKYIDFIVLLRKSSATNREAEDPWNWWELIMEIGYERIEEFKELFIFVSDIFIKENTHLQWKRDNL